jgi:hypothetical protein
MGRDTTKAAAKAIGAVVDFSVVRSSWSDRWRALLAEKL